MKLCTSIVNRRYQKHGHHCTKSIACAPGVPSNLQGPQQARRKKATGVHTSQPNSKRPGESSLSTSTKQSHVSFYFCCPYSSKRCSVLVVFEASTNSKNPTPGYPTSAAGLTPCPRLALWCHSIETCYTGPGEKS